MNAFGADYEHAILAFDGHLEAAERIDSSVPFELVREPTRAGSVRTVLAMLRLLKREKPDRVLTYNWGAMDAVVAARILGIPVVHHEDGFRPDEVDGQKARRVLFRRGVLGGCKSIVVPSETLGRIARDVWKLEETDVIPNGIHLDRFGHAEGHRRPLRAGLGIAPDKLVIGAVGHLRREKNPLRLVEAFLELEGEPHLVLVGDGPERERLAVAARPAMSRVHLVGHQEQPEHWLTTFDVFCLPSDTEQMPVALLEAMATRLPVAATDVGDVGAILPPEQAELVVPRDTAALSQALGRLLGDAELRNRLARANLERVTERFSFSAMKAAYRVHWGD